MRCVACQAAALQPLPPNRFSRHPGYACAECGKMMRPPGTTGNYIFVVFLGGFIFLIGVVASIGVLTMETIAKPVITGTALMFVLGGSTAVWAIVQLTRPIPLDAPPRPIRIWVVLVLLLIVLLLLFLLGAAFFGFAYFLHEM
jgi:hypothetical protein